MLGAVGADDLRSAYRRELLGLIGSATFALVVGVLAVRSTQVAVAVTSLVLLLAVRAQSRSAGLALMWSYWLLAPFLRRVLDLTVGPASPDPLSLLPFLATGLLAFIELRENRLDRRARTVLALAAAGFLLGAPLGLIADPTAASFAVLASAPAFRRSCLAGETGRWAFAAAPSDGCWRSLCPHSPCTGLLSTSSPCPPGMLSGSPGRRQEPRRTAGGPHTWCLPP